MNIYFVQGILVKTDKQNKLFEEFYKKQKICEDHEFNTFLDVCRLVSWVLFWQGYLFLQSLAPGLGIILEEWWGGDRQLLLIQDKKSLKNTILGVREGMIYLINYITFA